VIRTEIKPNEVFDREGAEQALGLTKSAIAREVRLRRLRASKRGGRWYFLGAWLLEWLRKGELRRKGEPAHVANGKA
jgi:hypothetical protein